jgi:hypothetical protein
MKTPFYIGQSVDDVLEVAKRTNRKRLAVEFTMQDGRHFRFDLDATSGAERRRRKAEMEAKLGGEEIKFAEIAVVKYFYPDCALTFEKNRGVKGDGARCYRVMEIERTDGDNVL